MPSPPPTAKNSVNSGRLGEGDPVNEEIKKRVDLYTDWLQECVKEVRSASRN
jgi:hypothetical protein